MKSLHILIAALALTLCAAFQASAASTEESVTINVGESKTLYLPNSVRDRNPYSVGFYTLAPDYVEVSSYTDVSVTIKGLKSHTSPVFVRCDYYYTHNGMAYSGAYNYKVTVKGGNGGGSDQGTFSLNDHEIRIKVGQTYRLGYTFTGDPAPVTWSVGGDPSKRIVSVDSQGNVSGLSAGNVPVYAETTGGRYDTCYVTVEPGNDTPDPTLRDGDLITSTNSTPEGHNLYFSVLSARDKTAQTGFVHSGYVYIANGMVNANTVTIPMYIKGFRVEHIQAKSLSSLDMAVPFEIRLPSTIRSIDRYAFFDNPNLTRIEIPDNITLIPDGCFSYCSDLKEIILPESLEIIDYLAFESCRSVEKIEIGQNIKEINGTAFWDCTALREITVRSSSCPEVTNSYAHIFEWNPDYLETVVLKVPSAAVETYRSDSQWKMFKNIVGIDTNGVEDVVLSESDMSSAPRYFNLQGVEVNNPGKGIYIKIQNGRSCVVLKNL